MSNKNKTNALKPYNMNNNRYNLYLKKEKIFLSSLLLAPLVEGWRSLRFSIFENHFLIFSYVIDFYCLPSDLEVQFQSSPPYCH